MNFSLHDILNGLKLISFCIHNVVEIFSLGNCSCLQINSLLLTLCKFIYGCLQMSCLFGLSLFEIHEFLTVTYSIPVLQFVPVWCCVFLDYLHSFGLDS
jgi:hypothetical protein